MASRCYGLCRDLGAGRPEPEESACCGKESLAAGDGDWVLGNVKFSFVPMTLSPGEARKYHFSGHCSECCIMNGELAVGGKVKFEPIAVLYRG
jgi:hypothetical protein